MAKSFNFTRRQFLRTTAMAGAAVAVGGLGVFSPKRAYPFLFTPPGISKFTAPLQGLGPTGIPVATPNTTAFSGNDYYKIVAGQFKQVFHPDFLKTTMYGPGFKGTTLWGYADDVASPNHRYLGGLIIANKGRPVRMQVRNNLVDPTGNPLVHPLAVDKTAMTIDPKIITPEDAALENRIGIHIHGGHVPWISDGGPFSWFGTPDPITGTAPTGPSKFDVPDMPEPPQGAMTFYYPMDQSARLLWYHDHAYGLTRLNAYAGLATGFLVLDQFEANLIKLGLIPDINHLVPLVLQDKSFVPPGGNTEADGRGEAGDLYYPSFYDPVRWDVSGGSPPTPSCVPEFFGDTTVINGVCYPFLKVEQRHYRFNFLNGSQARMFNLQLYYADPTPNPDGTSGTEIPVIPFSTSTATWLIPDLSKVKPGPKMVQIGTEGGFLPFPVVLNNPPAPFTAELLSTTGDVDPSSMTYNLLLGGAERADVIIDFSNCPVGSKLILYNDAPGPFPNGDPRYDYRTGSTIQSASGPAGFGPNTRTMMRFEVVARPKYSRPDPPQMNLLEKIGRNGLHGGFLGGTQPTSVLPPLASLVAKGKFVRRLGLYEDFDDDGRLRQLLGDLSGPIGYTDGLGEVVSAGDIEVWEIYNTTADAHPIHFHLVDVILLSRQAFVQDADGLPVIDTNTGLPMLLGTPRGPDNNERGWKETVRMNPGEVTRVIMKFDLPKTPFVVPASPRTGGNEYVWHCHILEHEEHDMMHALVVK